VVVRNDLNVVGFLRRVKEDSSFYKAFRNLRILEYGSINHIQMLDKKGKLQASLQGKTRQHRKNGCRSMEVLEEKITGDIYKNGSFNYYTAELYASLFFTRGQVCGENNIVAGTERKVRETKGLEKHKEQLKMLFFNPGKKIPGIPFIGDRIDIFDPSVSRYYDFTIDMEELEGQLRYVFRILPRTGEGSNKSRIVFDNITTWFDMHTMEIVARNYDLSYNTPAYDFDVHMEVKMTKYGELLVPSLITYNGNWKVAFKKRERGVFTALLYDFNR
ncbi:MAG: hypothetical protein ACXWV0_10210, partial [Flavisolibacter sp.]